MASPPPSALSLLVSLEGLRVAKINQAPEGRLLCVRRNINLAALQSQFLNFQDLSFHGVSVSSRHCTQRSGGQVLRRDLSLTSGSSTCFAIRRLDWCVASLIRSTNSGLLAMARSCEASPSPAQSAPNCLRTPFGNASTLRQGRVTATP